MNNEIDMMKRYMEKISLMVEDDEANTSRRYGMGGGEDFSGRGMSGAISESKPEFNKNIVDKINNLEKDLSHLITNLKNMRDKLNSTPSIFPVKGIITSGFGYRKSPFTGRREFHRGIDILNKEGTPVIAPADGIVKKISKNALWGLNILISHGYNIETQYGHLKEVLVKKRQKVKRGDIIGRVGKTGRTTGPHLHYQIWVNGVPVNPMDYIIEGEM